MATKSLTAKARVFKIVISYPWGGTTTRIYQSLKTYERAWEWPPMHFGKNRYDSYELKHGKWVHIGTQTLPEEA